MHKGFGMMGEMMGGAGTKTYMALWKYLTPEQQGEIAMRALDLKITKMDFKICCMQQMLEIMIEEQRLFISARDMLTSGRGQGSMGQGGYGMMGAETYGGYGRQMGYGGYSSY